MVFLMKGAKHNENRKASCVYVYKSVIEKRQHSQLLDHQRYSFSWSLDYERGQFFIFFQK